VGKEERTTVSVGGSPRKILQATGDVPSLIRCCPVLPGAVGALGRVGAGTVVVMVVFVAERGRERWRAEKNGERRSLEDSTVDHSHLQKQVCACMCTSSIAVLTVKMRTR